MPRSDAPRSVPPASGRHARRAARPRAGHPERLLLVAALALVVLAGALPATLATG